MPRSPAMDLVALDLHESSDSSACLGIVPGCVKRLTLTASSAATLAEAHDIAEWKRAAVQALLAASASTPRPHSAWLPFNYRRLPDWVRTSVAHWSVRGWQSESVDKHLPQWPVDDSVDRLVDSLGPVPEYLIGMTPVIVSHDIDTSEGLQRYVERFAEREAEAGVPGNTFLVPCGWPIDEGLLRAMQESAQVGIHGFDHSGRTPHAADPVLRKRIEAGWRLGDRIGATGYRAPSLLRTPQMLETLAEHYAFDSSIPTSGGPLPAPRSGAATTRPFCVGSILEIPVTLPRDGSLLFLDHTWPQILDLWKQAALRVAQAHGVVVLLTHCEERFSGSAEGLATFFEFIEFLREDPTFRFTTFDEITASAMASSATPRVA